MSATKLTAPARVAGGLFAFMLDVTVALFRRPFQLKEFMTWMISPEAQRMATDLHYAPLPMPVIAPTAPQRT